MQFLRDFNSFYEDVGDLPEQTMAFARLDKDKGFFPENCAWLSKSESGGLDVATYQKKRP